LFVNTKETVNNNNEKIVKNNNKQFVNHNKIGSIFDYKHKLEKVHRNTMVLALLLSIFPK